MATRGYKKKQDSIEVKIVLAILRGLMLLVTWPFRGKKSVGGNAPRKAKALDVADISRRWSEIQTKVSLGGSSHYSAAIMSADKLVDHVLRQKGYPGDTMGERLKSAKDDISPAVYHNLWQAHKLRNQLAHEVDSEVMSYQAKEAIQNFEYALRELGALR